MNIYDMTSQQMDDMATDYINGMYESQYDNESGDKGFYLNKIDTTQANINEVDNNEIPF